MATEETTIGITACSKSKVGGPDSPITSIQAQELYDSWLFSGRVEALKAHCDDWAIFSGEYGYLEPTELVEWYEQRISDLPESERKELAEDVAENVSHADKVMILMGRDYAEPLKEALNPNITVWDPLEGVQLFDQRSELTKLANGEKPDGQLTFDEM